MSEQVMSAEQHRAEAARAAQSAADSFERSDTDGFLSQWASDLSARKHLLAAEIAEAGGQHEFPGLFDAAGRRVKAKIVKVIDQYRGFGKQRKEIWLVLDANDKAMHWVPRQSSRRWVQDEGLYNGHPEEGVAPSKRSKMFGLGLHEGIEMAAAEAFIDGEGHGLSGRAWVSVKRKDRGYPADAVVFGSES
jgi:hypothetical protein